MSNLIKKIMAESRYNSVQEIIERGSFHFDGEKVCFTFPFRIDRYFDATCMVFYSKGAKWGKSKKFIDKCMVFPTTVSIEQVKEMFPGVEVKIP